MQNTALSNRLTDRERSTLSGLIVILEKWIYERRVGSVTINFFKGNVSSVKLEETIKLTK